MLLVSFKTCAAPGLLPAMVTVGPHEAISGRTLPIAAGSPDTITDSVPVRAPAGPPEIGQSTIKIPFGATAASTSRKNGTPTVQVFSSTLIALPAARPSGPSTAARKAASVGNETATISH